MQKYRCMPRPRIEEGGFAVTAVQTTHIEEIRQWRNAQIDLLRQLIPITRERQERYYAHKVWPSMELENPSEILLSFFEGEAFIGYGGLVHIAWEHRRTEISFLMNSACGHDSKCYGRCFSAYLRLIKQLAFDDLSLERLFTETYAFRTHHIAILERNGFRPEGLLRNHVRLNGEPIDSLFHGCLKTDER